MVPHFYEQVGQYLRAYIAPPPRIRREEARAGASEETDRVGEIAVESAEESRAAAEDIAAAAGNGEALHRSEEEPRATAAVPAGEARERPVDQGISERSEEHTSELQSLMRISYAVFCLKKKKK